MTPQALLPALVVPLILFGVYRRLRRTFGRQPIQPKRKMLRITLLSAIGAALTISAWHDPGLFEAALAGLALGAAFGGLGLRLTQFEGTAEGKFYTPNVYIGGVLTAVFLGRLVYRFIAVPQAMQAAAQHAPDANPFASFQTSPLTLGIFTMLVGYYVTYYVGILVVGRKH